MYAALFVLMEFKKLKLNIQTLRDHLLQCSQLWVKHNKSLTVYNRAQDRQWRILFLTETKGVMGDVNGQANRINNPVLTKSRMGFLITFSSQIPSLASLTYNSLSGIALPIFQH